MRVALSGVRVGGENIRDIPHMPFPRLTWAGLLIATLGWALLLTYPMLASNVMAVAGAPEPRDPTRFILIIGENAVITGLAIAMLGAAERMISLLNRQPVSTAASKPSTASSTRSTSTLTQPQLMSARPTTEVVTKGALAGRDYVQFRDGSVVVETLLGPRRFLSLTEAQEFIGAN
jgi:hypothetical protein